MAKLTVARSTIATVSACAASRGLGSYPAPIVLSVDAEVAPWGSGLCRASGGTGGIGVIDGGGGGSGIAEGSGGMTRDWRALSAAVGEREPRCATMSFGSVRYARAPTATARI